MSIHCPIVIYFNCQGCLQGRKMNLEFDGHGHWSFTEELADQTTHHAEFTLPEAIETVDYALSHIGGDKTYQNHLFLCSTCRTKVSGIKNKVLAEQRETILTALKEGKS